MVVVPQEVVNAVALLAEIGAEQVVRKTMPRYDIVGELCELDDDELDTDESGRWVMMQDEEEDWVALYCYKAGASAEVNTIVSKIRGAEDPKWMEWDHGKILAALPGAWIVRVQCDYKHFWVEVTAPNTATRVSYLFSIKNEEVMILDDTLKSSELNAKCEKHVERDHTITRICREDPNANECILRMFYPKP